MEQTTKREIVDNARKKVTPITDREKSVIKAAIENIALITTMVTIGAYVVMYAYKIGYYKVFGIPTVCVQVSLRDYLPFLFKASGFSIYVIWYIVTLKSDEALKSIKINGMRIWYGFIIIYLILLYTTNAMPLSKISLLLISFILSFSIEFLLIITRKIRTRTADRTVSKEAQGIVLQDAVSDIFFYRYYIRSGFFVFALIVPFALLCGGLIAKTNNGFQVFEQNEVSYAVIVDNGDSVIAQRVRPDAHEITINTGCYTFFLKDEIEFEYREYDIVSRGEKNIEDKAEPIGSAEISEEEG